MSMSKLNSISCSRSEIDFDEFQSVLQHLPPSIFFVILKSTENRSDYAQSRIRLYSSSRRMGSEMGK